MSITAHSQQYHADTLAEVLNELRAANIKTATCTPGNELAANCKMQAQGFLRALDKVAEAMGLTTTTEVRYSR